MKKSKREIAKLATPIKDILAAKGFTAEQIETFKNEVERDDKWVFDTVTIRDILSIFVIDNYALASIINDGLDYIFYEITSNRPVIDALTEVVNECPVTMNNFIEAQAKAVAFMMKNGSGLIDEEEKDKFRMDFTYLYRDEMELLCRYASGCPSLVENINREAV